MPLLLLITVLAVARVTRLINEDEILAGPRKWLTTRLPDKPAYLIICAWCASFWVAFAAAVLLWVSRGAAWFWVPAAALAFSHVTGLLKRWED